MCKLFAPTHVRASLEEIESRVLQLDAENQQLEQVLQENLGKKLEFSQNFQVETLQEIIEDYEARCRTQDVHIAEYINEIAELKAMVQELTRKNGELKRENGILKGKNHCFIQELEKKNAEIREMMQRSSVISLSSCSTIDDMEEFEEVTLEPCMRDSVKEKSKGFADELKRAVQGVSSEIKRLEIEGFEEQEPTVTNFFNRTPIKVLDMESGGFKRNFSLLKMKVMGTLGFAGGLF